MARKTVESLRSKSANAALGKIDRQIQSHSPDKTPLETFSQGPFGVLNISSDKSQLIGNTESGPSSAMTAGPRNGMPWPSPTIPQLNDASHEICTPESFNISPDFQVVASPPNRDMTFDRATASYSDNSAGERISTLDTFHTSPFSTASLTDTIPRDVYVIPAKAPDLIRYFKSQVRSLSYPLKAYKRCPWQTIHLPRAEKAYAELLIHQTSSNTGLSLFYSLLAGSCFHLLSTDDHSLDHETDGNEFKRISRHHLDQSIQQEIASEEKVKYKELLMALLSTVMLEVRPICNCLRSACI